jgi:uroporphyrin-III C-methyltransferase
LRGWTPAGDERRIVTTLSGLAGAAETLAGPALLMVGEAMALATAGSSPAGVQPLKVQGVSQ